MAEVVDWAPVDDDNNAAPPVGAPEGMMPAAVNNTMRAMMGSLRRMHDQIVAGTLALPYLPTAGGIVTGNVAINGTGGVALGTTQLRNISGGLEVYNAAGGGVSSLGPGAGYVYGDRDQVSAAWTWYANGGRSYFHNAGTGNVLGVSSLGDLTAAGSLDTRTYKIQGVPFATRTADADPAHHIYDSGGNLAIALHTNDNFYRANTHHWWNEVNTEVASLSPAGVLYVASLIASGAIAAANASVSGAVQANQLTSNANINAVGTITGGAIVGNTVHANTTVSAGTSVAAPTIAASGNMSASNFTAANSISAGTWINAPQYRLNGVPMAFDALFDQVRDLQERVKALETQARGVT